MADLRKESATLNLENWTLQIALQHKVIDMEVTLGRAVDAHDAFQAASDDVL